MCVSYVELLNSRISEKRERGREVGTLREFLTEELGVVQKLHTEIKQRASVYEKERGRSIPLTLIACAIESAESSLSLCMQH